MKHGSVAGCGQPAVGRHSSRPSGPTTMSRAGTTGSINMRAGASLIYIRLQPCCSARRTSCLSSVSWCLNSECRLRRDHRKRYTRVQEQKLKSTKVICGAKVPRVRKFHGTKVLGTFAPEKRKFHRSESSIERKFLDFTVPGSECSTGAKVLSMVFSLPGTKV